MPRPDETKLSWGMRLIGMANPIASYAMQAAVFVRDKEYKRETGYEPGTDMTLTVLVPTRLAVLGENAEWPLSPGTTALTTLALEQPLRTAKPDGVPSGLVNLRRHL